MPLNSNEVLYSKGKNDECYTPAGGVGPILRYVRRYKRFNVMDRPLIIWCPFDTRHSEFVKQLRKLKGVEVVRSHIDADKDFFSYEPDQWDIIISNPPFTNKKDYFERALSFNKPFALIMSIVWLNDSTPKKLWNKYNTKMQLLMFEKRMRFIKPDGTQMGSPTFSSAYFCSNFLPSQIIMTDLHNK